MTQEELNALVLQWQRVLRLQDWDVEVKVVRQWEFEGDSPRQAECHRLRQKRKAKILIADPIDTQPERWPYDPLELCLVHELLHLYTEPLEGEPGGAAWLAMEQMVSALSEAFYEMKRSLHEGQ